MASRSGSRIPEHARKTKVLTVRVDPQIRLALDHQAALWGISRSAAFSKLVLTHTTSGVTKRGAGSP